MSAYETPEVSTRRSPRGGRRNVRCESERPIPSGGRAIERARDGRVVVTFDGKIDAAKPGFLRRYIPIFGWLAWYRRGWPADDAVAGLSVWALATPHALASVARSPASHRAGPICTGTSSAMTIRSCPSRRSRSTSADGRRGAGPTDRRLEARRLAQPGIETALQFDEVERGEQLRQRPAGAGGIRAA